MKHAQENNYAQLGTCVFASPLMCITGINWKHQNGIPQNEYFGEGLEFEGKVLSHQTKLEGSKGNVTT